MLQDNRQNFDGKPLRQSQELPFLSGPTGISTTAGKVYCLYEAEISVAITGIDHWVWTAYGIVDNYFGSGESVEDYDELKDPTGRPDPLAAGKFSANNLIWPPREYFFKVLELRMNQVRRHWNEIIDKVKGDVKQQYVLCVDFIRNVCFLFGLG